MDNDKDICKVMGCDGLGCPGAGCPVLAAYKLLYAGRVVGAEVCSLAMREVARGDLDVWFPRWEQGQLLRGGVERAKRPTGAAEYLAQLEATHDRLMANYAEKQAAAEARDAAFRPKWGRR